MYLYQYEYFGSLKYHTDCTLNATHDRQKRHLFLQFDFAFVRLTNIVNNMTGKYGGFGFFEWDHKMWTYIFFII